ncbi:MAG: site-specific tyrosine recombinase XerC [Terriglobales bacterium]
MLRAKRPATKQAVPEVSAGNRLHGYRLAFLEWLKVQGRSSWTIGWQGNALTYFIRWCDERGLAKLTDFTLPVLERYQRYLFHYRTAQGKPLALSTQQQRLVVLKTFVRWAVRERFIPYSPAAELLIPRLPPRLPHTVLTIEEVERILAQPDVATAAGVRDRAALELLYSTALRRMELVKLQLHDLDVKNALLRVRLGKGRRDRVVPVGTRAIAWTTKYLNDVRPLLLASHDPGHVILTDFGEPFEKNRLGDMVKRYIANSGLKVPGACHLFRHAAATHMLENGADIRFIQAFLGHADLNATQIYTHVSIRKLQEIHAATHPAKLTRCERG